MNNSSKKPAEQPDPPVHFVAEGGIPYDSHVPVDPTVAFEDLMHTVEALCPVWPERPLSPPGGVFLM